MGSLRKHTLVLALAVVFAWQSVAVAGLNANQLGLGGWNNEFVLDNKELKGHWSDSRTWPGTLCNGSYSYDVNLRGTTHSIDFDVKDETSLDARAELRDLHFAVEGSYRSSYTACVPMSGWLGVGAESVKINAVLKLGEDPKDIKIRVTGTEFGTIHMGAWVPAWFETFVTNLVNRALIKVWGSRLGEWISDKITEELKKKLPVGP